MDQAPHVGSLVDWPTLKRIREIKDERQIIRYQRSIRLYALSGGQYEQ